MQFPRPRTEEINLNLTPLIDVVFLLLIFFMVSTTFTKETRLSLTLPKADGEAATQIEAMELGISAGGEYSVNGNALGLIDAEQLADAIKNIGLETGAPVILVADAQASHQSVVTAMDVVGKLGYLNISIATQETESK